MSGYMVQLYHNQSIYNHYTSLSISKVSLCLWAIISILIWGQIKIIQSLFKCNYLINIMWKFSCNRIMHKLKSISRCQHSCTLHLIWHLPLNFDLLDQTASSKNLIAMQIREAILQEKGSFFNIVKKTFDLPPPSF